MTDISEIVSVNVTVQDASVAVANFGTIAIFASQAPGTAGRWVGTYNASPSGLAAMVSDGFAVTDSAYLKAAAIAAQSPKVDKFKIYKRSTVNAHSLTVKVTNTAEGALQYFEIGTGGAFTVISRENGPGETAADIAAALALLAGDVTGIDTAFDTTDTFTITPAVAGNRIYIRNASRHLVVDDPSADAGIATDLAAAALEDHDFFGFVIDSTSGAEIAAAAEWAESNARMFLALSTDSDILAAPTTDVASALKAANYHFTAVCFSRDARGALDAGLLGRQLSRDPGSSTFANKTISGVAVDNLTATEQGNARSKNALTYTNVKGLSLTFDGRAASGRFLDITHGIEWLKARIGERILRVIANVEKVPFTDAGVALLEAEVRAQLTDAEARGLIAAGWTVTAPKVSEVSPLNKAERLLPDLKFAAVLQGAVHKVIVDGSVSV